MAVLMQAATKHQVATECSGCDIDAVVLDVAESREWIAVPVTKAGVRFVEMVVCILE